MNNAVKKICACLLAVQLLLGGGILPQGSGQENLPLAVIAEEESEPGQEEADKDLQLRTGLFYLMPTVIMSITLTVIVLRMKKENKQR